MVEAFHGFGPILLRKMCLFVEVGCVLNQLIMKLKIHAELCPHFPKIRHLGLLVVSIHFFIQLGFIAEGEAKVNDN